jgi:geranylgeranyl pyrophosphate synthase
MAASRVSTSIRPDCPTLSDGIGRTRQALHARLADTPAGELLYEYFERGKMLRAFVVYAAAASVGGDPNDVDMAAEAIELLHGASLIHDDIIDHAGERRGLAALHKRLGVGRALVVGDDLLLRAFAALTAKSSRHSPARLLEASNTLNQLARECCRGQFDELCAHRWVSEEEYLSIICAKTAAPFVAAGVLGVLLGGGSASQLVQIRHYSRHLGIAFQIDDDLMDLVGESQTLGKPAGNSLAEGRPMLPLIYLWQASSAATRESLARLGETSLSRTELVELLDQTGVLNRVLAVRHNHAEAAVAALEGFCDSNAVEALRSLALHTRILPLRRDGPWAETQAPAGAALHSRT